MKKLTAILLSLLIALLLCGCGNDTEGEQSQSDVVSAEASEDKTESEDKKSDSAEEEEKKEVPDESQDTSDEKKEVIEKEKEVPYSEIVALVGEYGDAFSERAGAAVKITDGNKLIITVEWADSASESSRWIMTATLSADGKLEYSDEKQVYVSFGDDGTETESLIYSSKKGYFTVKNGVLLWNGAYDKNCRQCRFEKIP